MANKSLLEQAKSIPSQSFQSDFDKEDLELVEAWLLDEISITQITKVKKLKSTGNVYCFLARGARTLFQQMGSKKR